MRSWPIFAALLADAAISPWLAQVGATACAEICYTTELTGFAPGGTPGCTCSGSQQGARTGTGGCNCGQCYEKAQGVVYGFAINADGACTYGTNCGACDYSSGSSASASGSPSTSSGAATATPTTTPTATPTATPSPAPATAAPATIAPSSTPDAGSSSTSLSTAGSSSASTSSDNSESSSRDSVGDSSGSHAGSEARDKGLSLWQIVLAICCAVLIFVVAVVSVCACYCKARRRLNEYEDAQANTSYYNPRTFQPWIANSARTGLPIATKTNANVV
ncbi:Non-structural maintenance of chromosomes element 4 A [Phytophthora pseudosyringae]|uniref:Non-structural maintenance of chromosomes element 4 A n=1 Tax=Phytophthora pseudosyringae TaxID=221518 RepID=A0A8T1VXM5_9STRA|nr:Non-structural maintenance of chromosomes element 4 A [Phytophthora pseudosyringae]